MNNLPGYDWAIEHGYTLMAHSGYGQSATYNKNGIFLEVDASGNAELHAFVEAVHLTVDEFFFPGNIEMFERQIEKVYAPFRKEWW